MRSWDLASNGEREEAHSWHPGWSPRKRLWSERLGTRPAARASRLWSESACPRRRMELQRQGGSRDLREAGEGWRLWEGEDGGG